MNYDLEVEMITQMMKNNRARMEQTEIRPGVFLTHHPLGDCIGDVCTFHNPTNHPLRDLPMDFIGGVMYRVDGDKYIPNPDDPAVRAGIRKEFIVENAVVCRQCSDRIVSTHRHDFKHCKCGAISVDGGADYMRRGAKDVDDIIDDSLVVDVEGNVL